VRMGSGAPWELYNLADDPNETTDLAARIPKKLAQLKERFESEKAKDAM